MSTQGELDMTLVIYAAEKVALISLCSAACKTHSFLTGSAYGKLRLVKQKRAIH